MSYNYTDIKYHTACYYWLMYMWPVCIPYMFSRDIRLTRVVWWITFTPHSLLSVGAP